MNQRYFSIFAFALLIGLAPISACQIGSESSDGNSSAIKGQIASEIPPYERTAFGGGWEDEDGDCRNTRMEVLADLSLSLVRYDSDGCRVVSGRWISEYTGREVYDASEVEIDHVVPLAYAWRHGAYGWTSETRGKFANDSINLLPVEVSLNRSKGDSPPSEWLPDENQCAYVSRFLRITKTYNLALPTAERNFIHTELENCKAAE